MKKKVKNPEEPKVESIVIPLTQARARELCKVWHQVPFFWRKHFSDLIGPIAKHAAYPYDLTQSLQGKHWAVKSSVSESKVWFRLFTDYGGKKFTLLTREELPQFGLSETLIKNLENGVQRSCDVDTADGPGYVVCARPLVSRSASRE